MDIIVLKLITNEEVLGEVQSSTETEWIIENPVSIAVVRAQNGQPNVGFAPFPIHAPQVRGSIISIPKRHVVYHYTPAEDFISNYNQIFGSGIVLPPTKQLIV